MSKHGLCCVECHASGTAQGEYAGMIVERERIIKLLEDKIQACNPHWPDDAYCDGCDENRAVIALIKGENK